MENDTKIILSEIAKLDAKIDAIATGKVSARSVDQEFLMMDIAGKDPIEEYKRRSREDTLKRRKARRGNHGKRNTH